MGNFCDQIFAWKLACFCHPCRLDCGIMQHFGSCRFWDDSSSSSFLFPDSGLTVAWIGVRAISCLVSPLIPPWGNASPFDRSLPPHEEWRLAASGRKKDPVPSFILHSALKESGARGKAALLKVGIAIRHWGFAVSSPGSMSNDPSGVTNIQRWQILWRPKTHQEYSSEVLSQVWS